MIQEKILVAVDFSEVANATVSYACHLGQSTNADVTFLHVVPEPSLVTYNYAPGIPEYLSDHQEEFIRIAKKKLHVLLEAAMQESGLPKERCHQKVMEGDTTKVILDYAKENKTSLLILGYKGHSTIERILIGSTVSKIVPHAPCTVMVYRPPA